MKTMQEIDTIYRAEMSRASLEGEQKGRQILILRQLNRRVGNLSIALRTQVESLPLEQLGQLGEDLLDFSGLEDLLGWLERYQTL
jgi:predicted transposase YdaD